MGFGNILKFYHNCRIKYVSTLINKIDYLNGPEGTLDEVLMAYCSPAYLIGNPVYGLMRLEKMDQKLDNSKMLSFFIIITNLLISNLCALLA